MKVWVIMGNDYPDSVFASEAAAEKYVNERKAEDNPTKDGLCRRIYWRAYEYEVRQ